MRALTSLFIVLFFAAPTALAQTGDSTEAAKAKELGRNYNLDESKPAENIVISAKPIVLNARSYNLTPDAFRKSALKGLLKFNWKIEANEATRVQGSYIKSGKTYKIEIRYTGDTIVIGFVPGFHHSGNGWLRKLANQVKDEVVAHSRDAEAQRYLNK